MQFKTLAISTPDDLIFGTAPHPLTTRSGMVLGGGHVYPELNFTLPALTIDEASWPKVLGHYRQIVHGALERAATLSAPGVQLECETLPPMTDRPAWAVEICDVLIDGMRAAEVKHGLKTVLRMTPNDNREMERPPRMRSGGYWERMLETFAGCAKSGAELLSIESVGGKEVHDTALTWCDIKAVIFALCIMGVRDMKFLWDHIVAIAGEHDVHAAGDTACGFGNTALALADQKLIPDVFAAIVRPITAIRSLVAYECGAVGPGKDCGYENPILKAITGFPMAMEGKTAACAHLSHLGNIAAATCDVWSNESVQNLKLLGGMAPTCYLEQLEYDCRLMNRAIDDHQALTLRDWFVGSDALLNSQAFVLAPEQIIAFAKDIVEADTPYHAGITVAKDAVARIRKATEAGRLKINAMEVPFLDTVDAALDSLPDDEETFIAEMMDVIDTTAFVAEDYGL